MTPDQTPGTNGAPPAPAAPVLSPLAAAGVAAAAVAASAAAAAAPPAVDPAPSPADPGAPVVADPAAPAATPPAGPVADPEGEGEGAGAVEDPEAAEGQGETPPADPTPGLAIAIPTRFPGQQLELTVTDQSTLEAVQMLVNGFMRGEQARTALHNAQVQRTQAEEASMAFVADPVAVLERSDAGMRAMIVRNLLLDDAVRAELEPDIAALQTTGAAAIEDKAKRQRGEHRDTMREQVTEMRQRQQFAGQVDTMLSEALEAATHLSEEDKEGAYDMMIDLLASHEERNQKRIRNLDEVRSLLAGRARLLNLSFDAPATAAKPVPAAKTKAPVVAPGTPAPAKSAAALTTGAAARAASAAAASTGRSAPAIPPSAPILAPKGGGLKDATAQLRKMSAPTT